MFFYLPPRSPHPNLPTLGGRRGKPAPQWRACSTLDHDIVAGSTIEDVYPRPTDQDIVAGTAGEHIVASTADQDIITVSAVCRQLDRAGRQARGLYHVIPSQGVDRQPVVHSLGTSDVHSGHQAKNGHTAGVPEDLGNVIAVSAGDDDVVRLAITGAASRRQIQVDLRDIGARQVVDHDIVSSAQGVEVDLLDIVEVHDHAGDVAEEEHTPTVGGNIDLLADV